MKTLREYIDLIEEAEVDPMMISDVEAKKYLIQKEKIAKQLMTAIGSGQTRVEREYVGSSSDDWFDYQVEYSPNDAYGHYIFWIWGPQETGGEISISGHFRSNTPDEESMKEQLDDSWTITGPYKEPLSAVSAHYKKIKPILAKWIEKYNNS